MNVSPNQAILEELKRAVASGISPPVRTLSIKTRSLVGIGAAVAMGASTTTYRPLVDHALAAGATIEECLGAFLAGASTIGAARIVTGAPRIAAALGYDVEEALECT